MAGIWNKLAQGQQLYQQKQMNALKMDEYNRGVGRDQQMRDVLSEAVTPSRPAMPQAEAMGPLPMGGQPLQDYPSQEFRPARMDMQNALGAMYEGGLGPEAMALEAKQRQLRGATPSMVNEYKFWEQLPPADQEKYLAVKRAAQIKKIGGVETVVSPISGTTPLGTLEAETTAKRKTKEAEVLGRESATEKALLKNLEASLPNLQNVVGKLDKLGKIATYTQAGIAKDAASRQLGLKMSKGAIARKEYISMVDNEILPLLKQTFGAAFTQKEGDTLKATLGDPDASPEEKSAVLKSFIESKKAQISVKRRRVGAVPRGTQGSIKAIGDKSYINIDGQWYEQ